MRTYIKVSFLSTLFSLSSLAMAEDVKEKISNAIDEINRLEQSMSYARVVNVTQPRSVFIRNGENTAITFDFATPFEPNAYVMSINSGVSVDTVKIHNKAELRSRYEVFSGRWGARPLPTLMYLENEGKIISTSGGHYNETAISFRGTNNYIYNSGEILSANTRPLDIIGSTNTVIHNTGTIKTTNRGSAINSSSENLYVLNEGNITSASEYAYFSAQQLYFKNTGTISSPLSTYISASNKAFFENEGTISGGVQFRYYIPQAEVKQFGIIDGNLSIDAIQSNLILNTNSVITGNATASRGNDTVTLEGVNKIEGINKFTGFEHLVSKGDWTVNTAAIQLKETATVKAGSVLTVQANDPAQTLTATDGKVVVEDQGALIAEGTLSLSDNVENAGKILVGKALDLNAELTLGNYQGQAGTLYFNTRLGDDASETSKLVITGDASGNGLIDVTNIQGEGDLTNTGIKLIDIQGNSNATFTLAKRVVAGVYDYILKKQADGWYLASTLQPEAGGYLANLAAANKLFDSRLEDRLGAARSENSAVWVRSKYNRTKFEATQALSSETDSKLIQLGADLVNWTDKSGYQYTAGLMTGYGQSRSDSYNAETGLGSQSKVNGFSAGAYATIYANGAAQEGLYADAWVLWNQFNAHISGHDKYKLSGITASTELGYNTKAFSNESLDLFLQPQGQITWFDVNAKEHLHNNTIVRGKSGYLTSRIGLKTFAQIKLEKATIKPFVALNWLFDKPYEISVKNQKIQQQGKAEAEIKMGVEVNVTKSINLKLEGAYQFGDQGYRDKALQLNVKWRF
ncbi:MAG: autotransporter outer membrane beta-barrel domain-containing protein [Lonepinella koalarum]|nr:autotransporter outer membrane beta-barrel domain-containing protein [Lonepinella koalarum]